MSRSEAARASIAQHLGETTRSALNAEMQMSTTSPDMILVPDEDLQQLSEQNGPASAEAQALTQLKTQRCQDLQVHCYRVGDTYLTGPLLDATEPASAGGELMARLAR